MVAAVGAPSIAGAAQQVMDIAKYHWSSMVVRIALMVDAVLGQLADHHCATCQRLEWKKKTNESSWLLALATCMHTYNNTYIQLNVATIIGFIIVGTILYL